MDKLETMEGNDHKSQPLDILLNQIKAKEAVLNEMKTEMEADAEYETAMAATAEEDAQIKNLHEDYQRYYQVNEKLETLRKNLKTTTLDVDPMDLTEEVVKCYKEAKALAGDTENAWFKRFSANSFDLVREIIQHFKSNDVD